MASALNICVDSLVFNVRILTYMVPKRQRLRILTYYKYLLMYKYVSIYGTVIQMDAACTSYGYFLKSELETE